MSVGTHKSERTRNRSACDDDKPTAVDLFCGCGGLTMGLKKAGFRVLAAVDVDPLSIKTFKVNHRDVKVWETDIRKLEPTELLDVLDLNRGELELLAGCPPCQSFSTLRTRNGAVKVKDPRNDLLLEFQRFVEILRPHAVMLENVPGLGNDERFASFCRKMKKLGYLGDHRVLNAADYGVPQRRHRLIYLAGYGMVIPFAGKGRKLKTVEDAIAGLPKAGESGDPVHDGVHTTSLQKISLTYYTQNLRRQARRISLPQTIDLHREFVEKAQYSFLDLITKTDWTFLHQQISLITTCRQRDDPVSPLGGQVYRSNVYGRLSYSASPAPAKHHKKREDVLTHLP